MRHRLAVHVAIVVLATIGLAGCGGGGGASVEAGGTLRIAMDEYSFRPSAVTIPAGDEVTLEFVNQGTIVHEFMAGREVSDGEGVPHGFQRDLFDGVDVTVDPESAVGAMGGGHASEGGHASGDDGGTEGDMEGGTHNGFTVLVEPGQTVSVTFTLPSDRTGDWTMGCFEQNGSHWDNGMEGTITVS